MRIAINLCYEAWRVNRFTEKRTAARTTLLLKARNLSTLFDTPARRGDYSAFPSHGNLIKKWMNQKFQYDVPVRGPEVVHLSPRAAYEALTSPNNS